MARPLIERRLSEIGERLRRLRADVAVTEEQISHLADEADEARVRHLVSETPLSERGRREADGQVHAMSRHREDLLAEVLRLEITQDELLDRMTVER
ncbi:MAG: hypothetical protein CL437_07290 [Acidimicrobiaceae bacterium]|jgi:septal ring factor EnvC (AmiA/AmiB activator)|nr:hypothetical protein [Acidimicrobiaceae bacterium]MCP4843541.1 hypothetical protein [Actinomycetes bacterium]MDP6104719.1 hypothetical protein [Acidimicrobiales bacterium]MDP6241220.1 hypothetical protein [Acidimicrobiales bacterium]MDP7124635.1 hypothetical protein [Acidimicrobiales bacterium]|tara:strand:- start:5513 stop:5803 length:291 start_codon:yes stop_codon:yes gene_type:complete